MNSGRSGRGPTSDISPVRTLNSWGNSSMRVRRRNLPTGVTLLSPAAAYITGSCLRVDGGTPNARTTWKLQPHGRSVPFEGFHRSKLPEALKKR